ncbi:hypothetical protein V1517DRAFT_312943 [Lipomyces orientalis]|uniref:Uncharacterized protein n=1 Tax=Lipomyces orientalis TaxID=1233043 RepID=A0ACC3TYZ5_9ASCO
MPQINTSTLVLYFANSSCQPGSACSAHDSCLSAYIPPSNFLLIPWPIYYWSSIPLRPSSLVRCRLNDTIMIEHNCTLRRSTSRGICAPLSSLPTPFASPSKPTKLNRMYSQSCHDHTYSDGCSMHIASLLHRRSEITMKRIEYMIDAAQLSLEILAASCCLLEKLSQRFYCRLKTALSDSSILGEVALTSAFMISSKYLEDDYFRLRTWASVGDLSISSADLRFTELQMLRELDFDIARIVTVEAIGDTICEFRSRQFCIDFLRPGQMYALQRSPVKETHCTAVYSVYEGSNDGDELTCAFDGVYLSDGDDTNTDSTWSLAPIQQQVGGKPRLSAILTRTKIS